ncbi:MAG: hypothetical protein HWD92_03975 [Flavobacteriia bacterium]|nr:hypothetical protein [Flavobacteriia bacterium]
MEREIIKSFRRSLLRLLIIYTAISSLIAYLFESEFNMIMYTLVLPIVLIIPEAFRQVLINIELNDDSISFKTYVLFLGRDELNVRPTDLLAIDVRKRSGIRLTMKGTNGPISKNFNSIGAVHPELAEKLKSIVEMKRTSGM